MRRALAVGVAALALSFAACSRQSDPFRALADGDYDDAVEAFEGALAELPPDDARRLKLEIGQIRALAHVDAASAAERARKLLDGGPPRLDEDAVVQLADAVADAETFDEARKLLEASVSAWPASDLLDAKYSDVLRRMEQRASAADLRTLESLGYLGGSGAKFRRRPGATTPQKTALGG